jgi:hypothetical protein
MPRMGRRSSRSARARHAAPLGIQALAAASQSEHARAVRETVKAVPWGHHVNLLADCDPRVGHASQHLLRRWALRAALIAAQGLCLRSFDVVLRPAGWAQLYMLTGDARSSPH